MIKAGIGVVAGKTVRQSASSMRYPGTTKTALYKYLLSGRFYASNNRKTLNAGIRKWIFKQILNEPKNYKL